MATDLAARLYDSIVSVERDQLRAQVAALTSERDALRARVAELEAHELEVSRLTGIVYEADYHCHAGPRNQVLAEIERLKSEARDAYELRQRAVELEAPPVVPEGWCVSRPNGAEWVVSQPRRLDRTPTILAAVYRALAWAIEHDERPPHAGDKP